MELQELKNAWNEYDKRTDDRVKINYGFIKKISLEKARSLLIPVTLGFIIEIVLNVMFLLPTINFATNYLTQYQFSLPALLLALLIVATIAWNIYGIIFLSSLSFSLPILIIQKKLQTFKVQNLYRQQDLLYIIYPLAQTCIIIIFSKAVININIYNYLNFLLLQLIAAFLIVTVIIWIVKKFPDKNMEAALNFLKDIKEFEKES